MKVKISNFIPTVTTGCVNDLWLSLPYFACIMFRDYVLNIIHATVANLNCVSVENFVQFVARGKVCVHKVEKIACDVCLKPNDIALPIVFQFMCEVAVF